MSLYNECPECNGALMEAITDTLMKCPRCGHEEIDPFTFQKNEKVIKK